MEVWHTIIATLGSVISFASDKLWTALIFFLLPSALFYSIKTKWVNIKMLPHAFKLLKNSNKEKGESLSSFQALATSLASVIGTGNIAGIAIAIYVGGPGTVFWIWLISLLSMATSAIEHTLAQVYKQKGHDGRFVGGPAYYLSRALNKPWLGTLFAILIIFTFSFALNGIQANTIANAFNNAWGIDVNITGVILAILTILIIMGSIKRIAKITEVVVPFMALLYITVTIVIMLLNY